MASISDDGRYVVFGSNATNLTDEVVSGNGDIFIRDLLAGTTTLVSTDVTGTSGSDNGGVIDGFVCQDISADDRYVIFTGRSNNLVGQDTSGSSLLFRRDLVAHTTTLITYYPSTLPVDRLQGTTSATISADGRYIATMNSADFLAPGQTVVNSDVFVQDQVTGLTTLASVSSSGIIGNDRSAFPTISGDGRFVAFQSWSTNLTADSGGEENFVHDNLTGVTTRIDVSPSGVAGPYSWNYATMSSDGQYVFFAANGGLLPNDTGARSVYRSSRFPHQGILARADGLSTTDVGGAVHVSVTLGTQPSSDVTVGVSLSNPSVAAIFGSNSLTFTHDDWNVPQTLTVVGLDDGTQFANVEYQLTFAPAQSTDVNYSAFTTPPITLVNAVQGTTIASIRADGASSGSFTYAFPGSLSTDGRFFAFESTDSLIASTASNGQSQIYLRDNLFNIVTPISVSSAGDFGDGASAGASVSSDGRFVVFLSTSTNLDDNVIINNGKTNVFLRDTLLATTTTVDVGANSVLADQPSFGASVSDNGRYVAFVSSADNLVSDGFAGTQDIFLRDMVALTNQRISRTPNGTQSNGASANPVISNDGAFIAYASAASNLVASDSNGVTDIFLYDVVHGSHRLISIDSHGVQGNLSSSLPSISADGLFVAFVSSATNLAVGDTNGVDDIFVRDIAGATTTLVSTNAANVLANLASLDCDLSADGYVVAFTSSASNLTDGDSNGKQDVFVHNTQTGLTTLVSTDFANVEGNDDSYGAVLSGDGRFAGFTSSASNLVTAVNPSGENTYQVPVATAP